jgi:hypothetical protein
MFSMFFALENFSSRGFEATLRRVMGQYQKEDSELVKQIQEMCSVQMPLFFLVGEGSATYFK